MRESDFRSVYVRLLSQKQWVLRPVVAPTRCQQRKAEGDVARRNDKGTSSRAVSFLSVALCGLRSRTVFTHSIFHRLLPIGRITAISQFCCQLRAFLKALLFQVRQLKKEKEDKKVISNRNSIYLVFYPRFLYRGCHQASLPSAEHQSFFFGFWRTCWISSLFRQLFCFT